MGILLAIVIISYVEKRGSAKERKFTDGKGGCPVYDETKEDQF